MQNLSINEEIARNLYLRDLALGKRQGPFVGKASIDKKWLGCYSEEAITKELPKMTIYQHLFYQNKDHLDDTAIISLDGTKTSYKELKEEINQCAYRLLQKGICPSDTVTLCLPNLRESIIAFYAINKLGAVAHMIHPLSSVMEIKASLTKTNSSLLFCLDSIIEKVIPILKKTNVKEIIEVSPLSALTPLQKAGYTLAVKNISAFPKKVKTSTWAKMMGAKEEVRQVPAYLYRENRSAVLLNSGGTTGEKKLVELTNDNFNANVDQFQFNMDTFSRGDRLLLVMPVFHGFGLCSSVHLPLSFGVCVIPVPQLDAKNINKYFEKFSPNYVTAVPTLLKAMIQSRLVNLPRYRENLQQLHAIILGGAPAGEELKKEAQMVFRDCGASVTIAEGYGLTEAVSGVTFESEINNNSDSIGIPMVKNTLKIVDMETKEELYDGNVGEICVKGPTVMKGYYNELEKTNETLVDDWLYTGDTGYTKNGVFYFSSRKGDIIISSGVNVYPNRIEAILEAHKAVKEAMVIATPHPYKMEVPKAVIALDEKEESDLEKITEELDMMCHNNLDYYHLPREYEYCSVLPRTPLGKISRKEIDQTEMKGVIIPKRLIKK